MFSKDAGLHNWTAASDREGFPRGGGVCVCVRVCMVGGVCIRCVCVGVVCVLGRCMCVGVLCVSGWCVLASIRKCLCTWRDVHSLFSNVC